jgi:hypothetical protein
MDDAAAADFYWLERQAAGHVPLGRKESDPMGVAVGEYLDFIALQVWIEFSYGGDDIGVSLHYASQVALNCSCFRARA